MPRSEIAYIDVSFFAHATEDLDKTVKAVQNLMPKEYVEKVIFKRTKLKGEYGNPITFFKTRIDANEISKALLSYISSNLSTIDKDYLSQNLTKHLNKGNLYLRLDKQEASKGKVKLCSSDPIRLRIHFRTGKVEEIRKICREMGLLPK